MTRVKTRNKGRAGPLVVDFLTGKYSIEYLDPFGVTNLDPKESGNV